MSSHSNIYIGNEACPTTEAVRERIYQLQEKMARFGRSGKQDDWRCFHNVFTLYVIWMFCYATGVRGIHTPYLPMDAIDADTGIARLRDKDSGDGTHVRLVWLPPFVREEMRRYELFLQQRYANRPSDLPCFFILDDGRTVEVCPSSQVCLMKEPWMLEGLPTELAADSFFPFRINVHRRFMINELAAAGCPPQLCDAWAGHWNFGEAPWQPDSSYFF
jgi:hypothetical protein